MIKPRWAFFISGQGSNMSALLDSREDTHVALVLSSNPSAPGLKRARREGIPTHVLDDKIDWQSVLKLLRQHRVDRIFLLGFMKIVPKTFLEEWSGIILNVHPSLLPSYPGLKSIERAYHDQHPQGATVHHVSSVVDAGKIILQKKAVTPNGITLEACKERVHWCEYALVRKAMEKYYA